MIAACAEGGNEWADTTAAPAPLVGVDGSKDGADRNCNVVLRELERPWTGAEYEHDGNNWVWAGTVEVSEAAAGEGLQPALMFQANGAWQTVDAVAAQAASTPGFVRYTVRIAAPMNASVELVPYLKLGQGGRLFDHNRNAGDTENYVIAAPDFTIWRKDAVCAPPAGPQRARLVFDADWTQHREGVLAPGGEVSVVYAPSRLAQCSYTSGGHALWDITAYLRFEPGGQLLTGSVRDGQWTVSVPSDARRASVWFEATSASGCHQWDSNFGNNYVFDAATPPPWVGNGTVLLTRATGEPCGGTGIAQGFTFDTWTRTRAAITNLCFEVYQPGMTDHDDPDLWQKVDVSFHWRNAGETTWHAQPVGFDTRVGNNARYVMSWRNVDPFRPYQCPTATITKTPDGMYDQTTVDYYVVVNGYELRPVPGGAFRGTFIDTPGAHYCN